MGSYTFALEDCQQKTSSDGNPYLLWRMTISDGEWAGHTVFWNLSLLPQSRWKVDEFLDAVKAPLTGEADPRVFIGEYVNAVCERELWEGKWRLRVRTVLPCDVAKEASRRAEATGTKLEDLYKGDIPF